MRCRNCRGGLSNTGPIYGKPAFYGPGVLLRGEVTHAPSVNQGKKINLLKVTLKVTRRETAHAPSLNQGEKINLRQGGDGACAVS